MITREMMVRLHQGVLQHGFEFFRKVFVYDPLTGDQISGIALFAEIVLHEHRLAVAKRSAARSIAPHS